MIDFFRSLNILSEEELALIVKLPKHKVLNHKDYLIKEGEVCNEITFVKSGILRSFYITSQGTETTNCIVFENGFMAAFSSYITQQPTEENIQAIGKVELMVLERTDLDWLYSQSTAWQNVGRILTEWQYVEMEKRVASFQKQSAKQRYETLLQKHSNYIKNVPLQYLASYLGITPRHLSRLRKES